MCMGWLIVLRRYLSRRATFPYNNCHTCWTVKMSLVPSRLNAWKLQPVSSRSVRMAISITESSRSALRISFKKSHDTGEHSCTCTRRSSTGGSSCASIGRVGESWLFCFVFVLVLFAKLFVRPLLYLSYLFWHPWYLVLLLGNSISTWSYLNYQHITEGHLMNASTRPWLPDNIPGSILSYREPHFFCPATIQQKLIWLVVRLQTAQSTCLGWLMAMVQCIRTEVLLPKIFERCQCFLVWQSPLLRTRLSRSSQQAVKSCRTSATQRQVTSPRLVSWGAFFSR